MSEIECLKFKSMQSGLLVGFANIYIPKWGVEICDVKLFQKNGARWVSFPAREYTEANSTEKKYFPYIRFRDKAHAEIFSKRVVEAIEKYCAEQSPSAFEDSQLKFF